MASEIWSHNLPRTKIVAALASFGYSIVQTYYEPCLFKTDAPITLVYNIMKAYKKQLFADGVETGDHNTKNIKETSMASRIMSKCTDITPDFEFNTEKLTVKQKSRG